MVPFPKHPQVNLPYLCPPRWQLGVLVMAGQFISAWNDDGRSIFVYSLFFDRCWWIIFMDVYWLFSSNTHGYIYIFKWICIDVYWFMDLYGDMRNTHGIFLGFSASKSFFFGLSFEVPISSEFLKIRGELNIFFAHFLEYYPSGNQRWQWNINWISTGYHMISYDIMINGGVSPFITGI